MPATTGLQRGIYVFHQASHGSGNVYYSYFDGQSWSSDTLVPDMQTNAGISAVHFNGKIYCFHGGFTNSSLYCNIFDGTNWSGDTAVLNTDLSFTPSAVVYNGSIYVFHHGNEEDGQLWCNITDGAGNWRGDVRVPNTTLWHGPSAVVLNSEILCFHQGYDSGSGDYNLWVNTMGTDNNWLGDQQVSNVGMSDSPNAILSGGNVAVFHQGDSHNQQLWYNLLVPENGWLGDRQIPNVSLDNSPGACLFNDRLYCFHQGTSDQELWCTAWLGYAWTSDVQLTDAWLWYSPGVVAIEN